MATPEDLARDLDADLKLCEAATAGPWEYACGGVTNWHDQTFETEWLCNGRPTSQETRSADGTFIAASREGWPAAIRMVQDARLRAERLDQENTELRLEVARVRSAMRDQEREIERLKGCIDELEVDVEDLEKDMDNLLNEEDDG